MPGYSAQMSNMPAAGVITQGQLVGLEGPYAGQVFSLSQPNMVIGRESDCQIVLALDVTISRKHAMLLIENGVYILQDNGSSNGTYVNGQRLFTSIPLVPDDTVQFGSSKFRFE